MVITDIKRQKYNESRYNIHIDSKFCFSASEEDIVKYSLAEGVEIEEKELEKLIMKCEETKAYNYALGLLNNRDYTSKDLKNKMKLKEYSEQTIDSVLLRLEKHEFVNDEKYAKKFIEYSLNIKKAGKNKIMHDLRSKGIKSSDMDSIEIDEEVQYSNACDLALKKIRSSSNTIKIEDKIFRYLLSKGYDYDLIKRVLRNLLKITDND